MKIALNLLFLNRRCDKRTLAIVKRIELKSNKGSIKFSLPKTKLKMYDTKTYKCVVEAEILVSPLKPITP